MRRAASMQSVCNFSWPPVPLSSTQHRAMAVLRIRSCAASATNPAANGIGRSVSAAVAANACNTAADAAIRRPASCGRGLADWSLAGCPLNVSGLKPSRGQHGTRGQVWCRSVQWFGQTFASHEWTHTSFIVV